MKKRNVLLLFGLCAMFAFTACGSSDAGNDYSHEEEDDDDKDDEGVNTTEEGGAEVKEKGLEGIWVYQYTIGEFYNGSVKNETNDISEELDARLIKISFDVQITMGENEIFTVGVTEETATKLGQEMREEVMRYVDAHAEARAEEEDMTVDEFYAYMETDRETLIEEMIQRIDIDGIVEDVKEDGTSVRYSYDDKKIYVEYFADGTVDYEYKLNGDKLTLKLENVTLNCTRK